MNDINFPTVATLALTALVLGHAPILALTTMALANLTQAPEPTVIQVQAAPAPTRVVIETCEKVGLTPANAHEWLADHEYRLNWLESQHEPYNGPLCDLEHIDCDVDPEPGPTESE